MKRICDLFKSIPSEIHVSKADFLLTVAVSVLAGTVVGMLISPRKNMKFGCENGNNFMLDDEDVDVEYEFIDED